MFGDVITEQLNFEYAEMATWRLLLTFYLCCDIIRDASCLLNFFIGGCVTMSELYERLEKEMDKLGDIMARGTL